MYQLDATISTVST